MRKLRASTTSVMMLNIFPYASMVAFALIRMIGDERHAGR
jgi:hypothetical protein